MDALCRLTIICNVMADAASLLPVLVATWRATSLVHSVGFESLLRHIPTGVKGASTSVQGISLQIS